MSNHIENIKTLSEAYTAVSDLKKKINTEAAEAANAIREKYASELEEKQSQYEFIKNLITK